MLWNIFTEYLICINWREKYLKQLKISLCISSKRRFLILRDSSRWYQKNLKFLTICEIVDSSIRGLLFMTLFCGRLDKEFLIIMTWSFKDICEYGIIHFGKIAWVLPQQEHLTLRIDIVSLKPPSIFRFLL